MRNEREGSDLKFCKKVLMGVVWVYVCYRFLKGLRLCKVVLGWSCCVKERYVSVATS